MDDHDRNQALKNVREHAEVKVEDPRKMWWKDGKNNFARVQIEL